MCLLSALAAIVGLIAGILVAVCNKKVEGVVYGKLDIAGIVTNVLLIPVYIASSLFIAALSLFANPEYDGFLGILGWIVCVIVAIAPLSCGLGLGYSVSLRKKGKSKKSFAVQFAGLVCCALSFTLFMLLYGNLLSTLN